MGTINFNRRKNVANTNATMILAIHYHDFITGTFISKRWKRNNDERYYRLG
jgi:hypothetical protein